MSDRDVLLNDVLLNLEKLRREAMVAADVATLSKLFSDDLVWVHSTGRADTKEGLLTAIGAGRTKCVSIEAVYETVRRFGDLALIGGSETMDLEIGGEPRTLHNRFTVVWGKTADAWRVVNWQSTSVHV